MERRLNPNSDRSIGQGDIKKPQTGDRKCSPNILEILARQSENLRDKEPTAAVSLLDTIGDPYGMLGYLVRRGLFLGEKKGQLTKEQITKAYSEARGLMWQTEKALEKYRDSNGATPDPEMLKKKEELKEVLNFYATFRLYCMLKKTDLKPNDFHNWVREESSKALSLRRRHVEMLSTAVSQSLDSLEQSNLRETQGTNLSDNSCRETSYADNNIIAYITSELSIYIQEMFSKVGLWFGDGHNLRAQREIPQEEQYDNSTSMSKFSDNSIEIALENEMVMSHAYRDLWAKYRLKQSGTEEFLIDYIRVQSIVETRIEDIKHEEREGFLNTMREVNQSLKKTAETLTRAMPKGNKDSTKDNVKEPLQLSLRDAIQETRRGNQWREVEWPNIAKRFDLNDDWIGIRLKKEYIEESCTKHRENVLVRQIIDDDRDAMQVAYHCSPSKVVETYEKLTRANASLKYICNQFNPGIPAKFEPKHIKGRDVLAIPFHNNNCLIHALIKVSNSDKQWSEIEDAATSIRNILVDEGLATKKEFLDLHSVGRRVIKELIKKEWFEPSRGLVVYQAAIVGPEDYIRLAEINEEWIPEAGKMVVYCHEEFPRIEENPAKPEYALFVKGLYHFQPMLEPM